jgi:Zn-dependent protease with chaperone function
METKNTIKGDYKKWLLYSFNSGDHQQVYDLYKALEQVRDSGSVKCQRAVQHEGSVLFVSAEHSGDDLIIREDQQEEFKKYLADNYLGTKDVGQWYKGKAEEIDREKNFGALSSEGYSTGSIPVKPHPKELFYLKVRIAVAAIFYLLVVIALTMGLINDKRMIGSLVAFMIIILVYMGLVTFAKGLVVGLLRGHSIQLTPNQFPEIYSIIKEEAEKLQLKKLPDTYIMEGPFNAFVMSFARSKVMMLYSGVVETALRGEYDVVRFVIAHELCHIKRKHLWINKILFPTLVIPFLNRAHSRGCEYTCDRTGYLASPKGAIEGILIMTTGKEIYSKFNVDLHLKTSEQNADFWTWVSEKFLTHPHPYKRLGAIKEFSKYN